MLFLLIINKLMKLLELFKSSSGLYWDLADDYKSYSTYIEYIIDVTDKEKIHLVFIKVGHNVPEIQSSKSVWDIEFTSNVGGSLSSGITGSGNAMKVFAAINECLQHFIRTKKPDGFQFEAFEPSRKKLYDVLSKKLSTELGWTLEIKDDDKNYKNYPARLKGKRKYFLNK